MDDSAPGATPEEDLSRDRTIEEVVRDLEAAEFTTAFRGFEPREVRELLDRVTAQLKELGEAGGDHGVSASDVDEDPSSLRARVKREAMALLDEARRDAARITEAARADAARQLASAEPPPAGVPAVVPVDDERLTRIRDEAERQAEEMLNEAAVLARKALSDAEERAERRAAEVEGALSQRKEEVASLESELSRLRDDLDDLLRVRDSLDGEVAERRARAEEDLRAERGAVLARAEEEAAGTVNAARESIATLEEAHARAERELDSVLRRTEAVRSAAQAELQAARREMEAARVAIAEAESRRRESRRLWTQEWDAMRHHVGQVAELVARVGPVKEMGDTLEGARESASDSGDIDVAMEGPGAPS